MRRGARDDEPRELVARVARVAVLPARLRRDDVRRVARDEVERLAGDRLEEAAEPRLDVVQPVQRGADLRERERARVDVRRDRPGRRGARRAAHARRSPSRCRARGRRWRRGVSDASQYAVGVKLATQPGGSSSPFENVSNVEVDALRRDDARARDEQRALVGREAEPHELRGCGERRARHGAREQQQADRVAELVRRRAGARGRAPRRPRPRPRPRRAGPRSPPRRSRFHGAPRRAPRRPPGRVAVPTSSRILPEVTDMGEVAGAAESPKRRECGAAGGSRLRSGGFGALVVVHALSSLVFGSAPHLAGLNLTNVAAFGATALMVRRAVMPGERRIWLPLAIGMSCYSLGFVVYAVLMVVHGHVATPSAADPFWLALYPGAYVTIALLVRRRVVALDAGLWLDGACRGARDHRARRGVRLPPGVRRRHRRLDLGRDEARVPARRRRAARARRRRGRPDRRPPGADVAPARRRSRRLRDRRRRLRELATRSGRPGR